MHFKKLILTLIATTSLLLFWHGTVFALEISWPTIGSLSIKSGSSVSEVAQYFIALLTAAGSVIMFGMITKGGIEFITANGEPSKISSAKNKMAGSAIGMVVMLSVFVILNSVNSSLVNIEDVSSSCVTGVARKATVKYLDSNGKEQEDIIYDCINSNEPDLLAITKTGSDKKVAIEDLGSSFPLCYMREVITFSEKNYKGARTVIFKDDTVNNDSCPTNQNDIKLGGAKSVKFMLKQDGVYLYGQNNQLPECGEDHQSTKDPPVDLCKAPSTSKDLVKKGNVWHWKCVKDEMEVDCWTIDTTPPKPKPCKQTSIKVGSAFARTAERKYEDVLLSKINFYWDGVTKVEISSKPNELATAWADDLFIIKNNTHGLEKIFGSKTVAMTWSGTPEIMSMLRKGNNELEFHIQDWWAHYISSSDYYIYYCKKAEDSKAMAEDDDPVCEKNESVLISKTVHVQPTHEITVPSVGAVWAVPLNPFTPINFVWDGESTVSVSGSPDKQNNNVGLDDSLYVKNETNGKTKVFLGTNHSTVFIGDLSIVDILEKGTNKLMFEALDTCRGRDCTGVDTIYLFYCKKWSDSPEPDPPDPVIPEPEDPYIPEDPELGPLFFNQNAEDLNLNNFNDKVKKIEFTSKDLKISSAEGYSLIYGKFYGAVLFSNPSYSGKCFYLGGTKNALTQKDLATKEEVKMENDLSSMIVFKSDLTFNTEADFSKGTVDLYATPNCGEGANASDDSKYDVCSLPIQATATEYVELEKVILGDKKPVFIVDPTPEPVCAGKFLKPDKKTYYDIQSLRINGSAGVVLKSDTGNCHYFEVKNNDRRSNCIANLQDTFKSFLGQEKVKTIMIVPIDQSK